MVLRDSDSLCVSYPAVAASVPRGRRTLAAFAEAAGATDEQLHGIRLAVSEALTNVVLHAYDDRPGRIYLTAAVTYDELWVLIADEGHGLRARDGSPGLGLGLALIAQTSEELAIVHRSYGGLELRMRFALGMSWGDEGSQPRGSVASAIAPASSRFSTTT